MQALHVEKLPAPHLFAAPGYFLSDFLNPPPQNVPTPDWRVHALPLLNVIAHTRDAG